MSVLEGIVDPTGILRTYSWKLWSPGTWLYGGNVGTARHPTDPKLDADPWLTYTHSEKRLSPLMAISPNITCNLSAHIDEAAFAGHGVVLIAIAVS